MADNCEYNLERHGVARLKRKRNENIYRKAKLRESYANKRKLHYTAGQAFLQIPVGEQSTLLKRLLTTSTMCKIQYVCMRGRRWRASNQSIFYLDTNVSLEILNYCVLWVGGTKADRKLDSGKKKGIWRWMGSQQTQSYINELLEKESVLLSMGRYGQIYIFVQNKQFIFLVFNQKILNEEKMMKEGKWYLQSKVRI